MMGLNVALLRSMPDGAKQLRFDGVPTGVIVIDAYVGG